MGVFTFSKSERLCKKKLIQELFDKGSSFYLYPFKVFFLPDSNPEAKYHQVLFSVSKKSFKRAVDRNLIKRRMRESYRMTKNQHQTNPRFLIAYIYTAKEILLFGDINTKLEQTLKRLEQYGEKKK